MAQQQIIPSYSVLFFSAACRDDLESSDESETEMDVDGAFSGATKAKHDLMSKGEVREREGGRGGERERKRERGEGSET